MTTPASSVAASFIKCGGVKHTLFLNNVDTFVLPYEIYYGSSSRLVPTPAEIHTVVAQRTYLIRNRE
jgi:hypothetical protein